MNPNFAGVWRDRHHCKHRESCTAVEDGCYINTHVEIRMKFGRFKVFMGGIPPISEIRDLAILLTWTV